MICILLIFDSNPSLKTSRITKITISKHIVVNTLGGRNDAGHFKLTFTVEDEEQWNTQSGPLEVLDNFTNES